MGKNAVTVRAWVLPNAVRSRRLLRDGIPMTLQLFGRFLSAWFRQGGQQIRLAGTARLAALARAARHADAL